MPFNLARPVLPIWASAPCPLRWMFSRCWSHPLTLTHLPWTPLAAHSKLWLSVMGGVAYSGKQWSGQVITGQANRGPMKHENFPSPKRLSLTHSHTLTDTHTRPYWWTEMDTDKDICKHVRQKYILWLLGRNHRDMQKFLMRKERQAHTVLHTRMQRLPINAFFLCAC